MSIALSHLLHGDALLPKGGDVQISGLTANSRDVKPGFLFAALPGAKADGATFIDNAFAQGAAAVICKTGSYKGKHKARQYSVSGCGLHCDRPRPMVSGQITR